MGADTEPGTIQGVRWLLLEALSNLVNNSIAHTPAGGTITVRCGVAAGLNFSRFPTAGLEFR